MVWRAVDPFCGVGSKCRRTAAGSGRRCRLQVRLGSFDASDVSEVLPCKHEKNALPAMQELLSFPEASRRMHAADNLQYILVQQASSSCPSKRIGLGRAHRRWRLGMTQKLCCFGAWTPWRHAKQFPYVQASCLWLCTATTGACLLLC